MKFFLVAAVVGLVVGESFYYETENDYVDIDAVINDLPTLQSYVDCFLDRKPCTSLTASFKKHLQDAVIRACDRCKLPQKQRFQRFLQGLQVRLPLEYINFRQKYDPLGIYWDRLQFELARFANYGIPLGSVPLSYIYLEIGNLEANTAL